MAFDTSALWNIGIATLAGMAVGLERQWSGKAEGPGARFAGLRTFTLLGLVGGLSGWLWNAGMTGPAMILLAGLGALVVVAYHAASRTDVDGTTEVAAFVVLAAGVLAGTGHDRIASGVIALTLLLLVEKRQLHGLVSKLDLVEVRAGARFAVMAMVILPLLPEGPYGPLGGVRPRQLWALVLFFSGLSFVGYLARRAAGPSRGYALAGTLGGIVSSTSVTLTFSRLSRSHAALARPLAAGVMGANLMLFPRVLIASLVLAPQVAAALWPAFIAPAAVAGVLLATGLRDRKHNATAPPDKNPLQIREALQMAAIFQVVLFGLAIVTARFGAQGLLGSAAILGLTDVDALTMSMSKAAASNSTTAGQAATAITLGIFVNTLVKLGLTLAIGRGAYRRYAAVGLSLVAAALAGGLWLSQK
jgi:uncharacterized membrane protein (DUF4010 family)